MKRSGVARILPAFAAVCAMSLTTGCAELGFDEQKWSEGEDYDKLLENEKLVRFLSVGARLRFVHAGTIYEVFKKAE